MNPTGNHDVVGLIPGLAQWGKNLVLLCAVVWVADAAWLWRRPAAVAPVGPLAWEPPYAVGAAIKRQKRKRKPEMNKWMMPKRLIRSVVQEAWLSVCCWRIRTRPGKPDRHPCGLLLRTGDNPPEVSSGAWGTSPAANSEQRVGATPGDPRAHLKAEEGLWP